MASMQGCIRRRFPSVRQLTTQRLAEWLEDDRISPRPLLVDARSEREFSVSHLRGAHRFISVGQIRKQLSDVTQPVVVYCSVGYRSSAVAEKLQQAGLANVWNLDGSLFVWVNEGRPVYRGTERLSPARVHPYNRKWAQLLKPEHRAVLK